MFGSIEPTPYDLRFSLFRIPVRVSVWFWVMGLILGYPAVHLGGEFLLAWVLVLFVSILVHELGHALLALSFGYPPRILLYQFGGLAMFEPYRGYTRARSILISLAGPGAGFVLFGLTLLFRDYGLPRVVENMSEQGQRLVAFVILQMIWINLWWGLVNLLPVLPLDGGQICREICSSISPHRGVIYTARVSAVVAGGVALLLFSMGLTFGAVLFALLCAQNISSLQGGRGGW